MKKSPTMKQVYLIGDDAYFEVPESSKVEKHDGPWCVIAGNYLTQDMEIMSYHKSRKLAEEQLKKYEKCCLCKVGSYLFHRDYFWMIVCTNKDQAAKESY